MTSEPALPPVIGAIADDRDGTALGTVTALFLDDVTGEPTWVGLTGGQHAAPGSDDVAVIAPMAGADFSSGRLRLGVPAGAVHTAPRPGTAGHLTPAEELTLREHYAGGTTGHAPNVVAAGQDIAMTRSEERLRVSTVREAWTRAVLRVETVTEQVMVPVTVTRQQARIEYLPVLAADTATGPDAPTGNDDGTATGWVTLFAEQPVVDLQRVPAERVRLVTSWVAGEHTVTTGLRHEEIALEDAPSVSPSI